MICMLNWREKIKITHEKLMMRWSNRNEGRIMVGVKIEKMEVWLVAIYLWIKIVRSVSIN